jgi:nucleotidyltransferase substrate binding protein (TIGR01987 family)
MERLKERLAVARQALGTLQEISKLTKTAIVRDAAIQRFEYTFEAVWKAAQMYLRAAESLDAGSPKSVIRASFRVELLTEEQTRKAMAMADDRNLTVHTYNEFLADAIYSRIAGHAVIMEAWLAATEDRIRKI